MSGDLIHVEVVYALREEQILVEVELERGASVRHAILRSGILPRFPEIDVERTPVGIFGKVAGLDTPLDDGDRVEIYRPLLVDPKDARRKRVKPRG